MTQKRVDKLLIATSSGLCLVWICLSEWVFAFCLLFTCFRVKRQNTKSYKYVLSHGASIASRAGISKKHWVVGKDEIVSGLRWGRSKASLVWWTFNCPFTNQGWLRTMQATNWEQSCATFSDFVPPSARERLALNSVRDWVHARNWVTSVNILLFVTFVVHFYK